ncbi:hypothetical protein ACLMJK_004058 [Lecanora helva]
MERQILFSAAIALSNVAIVAGQAAATTSNPLNDFIGAAGAAASVVRSAQSKEASPTSSSSTSSPSSSPTPAPAAASPTHSAAAAHHGLSQGAKIGIIIGAIVAALLLIAIIGLLCCCLIRSRRRKRNRSHSPVAEQEPEAWKAPINPGRHYSNYTPAQRGQVPMEQSPTIPLMAAAATEHHRATHSQAPSLSQHPAMRQGPENPFVPVPPSPRRSERNSRSGLTDAAGSHTMSETQPLRDRSTSHPNSRPQSGVLPTHNDSNRPPTPFGLTGFFTPVGQKAQKGSSPPYNGIGQPYEDMHVHVLQTDPPSRELRKSPKSKETAGVPTTAYDSDEYTKYRNSHGFSTPPEVPSRSPNRAKRDSVFADSSYESSLSNGTTSNGSGQSYHRESDPYAPAHRESMAPWEQHQHRFSNTPHHPNQIAGPPPIPWEDSGYSENRHRRNSHSPRQSMQYDGRRRSSRSPATSINGQPRRLRFEDLHADGGHGYSYNAVPGQHDSYDGYDDNRWSQGVGEAL